jgi:glucuronosyltransferase
MDEATEGVILFSLGSLIKVSSVADGEKFEAFSRAFSRLKQKVLWKWETDLPKVPDNVMVSKWFPQQDILGQ